MHLCLFTFPTCTPELAKLIRIPRSLAGIHCIQSVLIPVEITP